MERATGIEPALQAWETCAVTVADLVQSTPAQVSNGPALARDHRSDHMPAVATGTRMARNKIVTHVQRHIDPYPQPPTI